MKKPIMVDGIHYTFETDDSFLDPFVKGYEPQMIQLFRAVAGKSRTILDIGANLGILSVFFARIAKTVYAFEPCQASFDFLSKNMISSGCSNVIPIRVALGETPSASILFVNPLCRATSFIRAIPEAPGCLLESICTAPLDDVVSELKVEDVDFIKIDVEGCELDVIRGANKTLSRFKPVVVLELCVWTLNCQKKSVAEFFDLLRETFPIALAVFTPERIYADIHNPSYGFRAMYSHVMDHKFDSMLCAYDENRLTRFRSEYKHII